MTTETDLDRIKELEGDNRRLRLLLDQQGAPGELRHRLRSTLALLRGIIRRSANTERDLPEYVAQLEDRMDAIVRAQALADQQGEVDLHTLLADEMLHYGALEGERLVLSGPIVRFTARAGQLIALAMHELAVNAVEHGALGVDQGRIDVVWRVAVGEPDARLVLTWTEREAPVGAAPAGRGFGAEVLTQMIAYELKGETNLTFSPDGLRCTVAIPFAEQVGRVLPA